METLNTTVIVDDHDIFREGISALLILKKFTKKVYEAKNGLEFLNLIEKMKPDLVLLDISMPKMDGFEAASKAMLKYPDLNIIVLSMHGDSQYYHQMIDLGVRGFILKSSGKDELENAIKIVSNGGSYFSTELLQKIIAEMNKPMKQHSETMKKIDLQERETVMLTLLCSGFSATEIAEKMHLSKKTIEGYRSRLFQKTGTKTSTGLIVFAIKNQLISI